jgi:hypothetical protein
MASKERAVLLRSSRRKFWKILFAEEARAGPSPARKQETEIEFS